LDRDSIAKFDVKSKGKPFGSQPSSSSVATAPTASDVFSSTEFLNHIAQMFEAKIEFFGIQVDDLKKENADLKMEVATLKTQLDSHFFVQCSLEVSSLADSSRRML
jgi:hypothetical protein